MEKLSKRSFAVDHLEVAIFDDPSEMGRAAASAVAQELKTLAARKHSIRMVFAAAPSQNELLASLCWQEGLPWHEITAFHMDEYLDLALNAQQLFGNYLRRNLFDKVSLKSVHYIDPNPPDRQAESLRYTDLLEEAPIDIVCMGIGENGHIAFNDPPVADFADPRKVKVVELEEACRRQQVNDGCFGKLDEVPRRAITLTIPVLMSAASLFIVVPGPRKAEAVRRALEGPITSDCPASILRKHSNARLFLDVASASELTEFEPHQR